MDKRIKRSMTRREMLNLCSNGFGSLALIGLMGSKAFGNTIKTSPMPLREPHFTPKAKNVIFLYMDGGPSQADTFDPKPRLTKEDGKPFGLKIEPTQFNNNGGSLGSPWAFKQYGESGIPVSELFPHVATCVDDLAVIRSMYAEFSEHTNGNYFLHTGHGLQGRPSMGEVPTNHGRSILYHFGERSHRTRRDSRPARPALIGKSFVTGLASKNRISLLAPGRRRRSESTPVCTHCPNPPRRPRGRAWA